MFQHHPRLVFVLAASLTLLGTTAGWAAAVTHLDEDFSTATYYDPYLSTAEWDTHAGEIRLPNFTLTVHGSLAHADVINDVVPRGRYAFVASYGLWIADLADPANPTMAMGISLSATVNGLDVSGRYTYLACRTDGLKIVDVADPLFPVVLGTWSAANDALRVTVVGELAFVADRTSLQILDVSDPLLPVIVGSYAGDCYDVAVDGKFAYLAASNSGLRILDVSDPTLPVLVGQRSTGGQATGIAVVGELACVGSGTGGLALVDVADPALPDVLGTVPMDFAGQVYVEAGIAYVADQAVGLHACDITDPNQPRIIGSVPTTDSSRAAVPFGRWVLHCERNDGLTVVEAAVPLTEAPLTVGPDVGSRVFEIATAGDLACVASGSDGLRTMDIVDPGSPQLLGHLSVPDVQNVGLAGPYAYLAAAGDGLLVADVSDPTAPHLVSDYDPSDLVYHVEVDDRYAYVIDDDHLKTVDISDPTNPAVCDSFETTGYTVVDFSLDGNHAAFLERIGNSSRLMVVDCTDRYSLTLAGYNSSLVELWKLAIRDRIVYGAGPDGLVLAHLDLSNATIPVMNMEMTRSYVDVVLIGNLLYATSEDGGLFVFDVSDEMNFVYVDEYEYYAWTMTPHGDFILGGDLYISSLVITAEVLHRRFALADNEIRTLDVTGNFGTVLAAALTTEQVGTVNWEFSCAAGVIWEDLPANGEYVRFPAVTIADLRWRSTHVYTGGGINPTCRQLSLDWLYEFGVVTAVEDFPADQGGQIRLRWLPSGHDMANSPEPITEYAVYRRIDDVAAAANSGDSRDYPPGDWEYIASVPATADLTYATVVPSAADSTISGGMHWSAYFVRALTDTPWVYYNSPPDSGYSLDNLAPSVPAGLTVAYGPAGGNELAWEESPDVDFRYFNVYRGPEEDFDPSPDHLVHQTTGLAWTDPDGTAADHYLLTAVDFAGNESEAAGPTSVTGVPGTGLPRSWTLHPCAPNPFNPQTVIGFETMAVTRVQLAVYDAVGRRVKSLVDEVLPVGRHDVIWRGRDDAGRPVGSGVYFCRFEAGGYRSTQKMLLVQ